MIFRASTLLFNIFFYSAEQRKKKNMIISCVPGKAEIKNENASCDQKPLFSAIYLILRSMEDAGYFFVEAVIMQQSFCSWLLLLRVALFPKAQKNLSLSHTHKHTH